MPVHPNSLKNLEKGEKFAPGDSRIKRGRTTRNRKTLFTEWLEMEIDCKDPAGNKVQLPLIDKVILAIISKASKGDISAANVVLDNAYGKLRDPAHTAKEATEKQEVNWAAYTEDELKQLVALLDKGIPGYGTKLLQSK